MPGSGLYIINLSTGNVIKKFSSGLKIASMTWSKDGNKLYGAVSNNLYRFTYVPATETVTQDNFSASLPGDTDGMDMTNDGWIVGLNGKNMYFYNPVTGAVKGRSTLTSFYNMTSAELGNIDGFSWLCENSPN